SHDVPDTGERTTENHPPLYEPREVSSRHQSPHLNDCPSHLQRAKRVRLPSGRQTSDIRYVSEICYPENGCGFRPNYCREGRRSIRRMISNMARSSLPALRHPIQITKESLGIQTRKSILYLDQNFFSSLYRGGNPQWKSAMERITELLDLQLVAIPYSPTHEAEADFYKDRDDLVKFIYGLSRGLRFEPYYQIEETQILKAFQAYLANAPAAYVKEERDALPSRVHEWDGPYCVSVFRRASDVERKLGFKQQAVEELVATLGQWAASKNTFEQDMALELSDSARIFMQS